MPARRAGGTGGRIFLNVLQAINDWGSAITSEARALTDYNVLLATLERQTGTILETHGLVFVEERFQAVGPLCHTHEMRDYPRDLKPTGEPTQYPDSGNARGEPVRPEAAGGPAEGREAEGAGRVAGAEVRGGTGEGAGAAAGRAGLPGK